MGMAMKSCRQFFLLVALLHCTWASAQEGHPYEGTWRGTINMGATIAPMMMEIHSRAQL
jgi:hypothetical protein